MNATELAIGTGLVAAAAAGTVVVVRRRSASAATDRPLTGRRTGGGPKARRPKSC